MNPFFLISVFFNDTSETVLYILCNPDKNIFINYSVDLFSSITYRYILVIFFFNCYFYPIVNIKVVIKTLTRAVEPLDLISLSGWAPPYYYLKIDSWGLIISFEKFEKIIVVYFMIFEKKFINLEPQETRSNILKGITFFYWILFVILYVFIHIYILYL